VKTPSVGDLQPGQTTTGVFLVQAKEVRQKKSGEPYLSLTLADRTGEVDAKMWDNVEAVMETFERNDFVRVAGLPSVYNNRLQFTVHKLVRVSDDQVDRGDFFPASPRDRDEMLAELRGVIGGMGNQHLRGLLERVFADEGIADKFKTAPAAKSIHHAWLGGLIEHVLSLCTLVKLVAPHYPHVDADLVLTGAILHDIGKIEELTYERGFGYSDAGQLIGHIQIGLGIVNEKVREVPGFPPKLKLLVDHLILSHHGELEYGSPKVPLFAEAMLLHHLDNLDSKMETIRGTVERDRTFEGSFTSWSPSLERPLLKKDKFLSELDEVPKTEPAPPPAAAGNGQKRRPAKPDTTPSLFGERLMGALKDE
jgi:3'-5' exoribonuclease